MFGNFGNMMNDMANMMGNAQNGALNTVENNNQRYMGSAENSLYQQQAIQQQQLAQRQAIAQQQLEVRQQQMAAQMQHYTGQYTVDPSVAFQQQQARELSTFEREIGNEIKSFKREKSNELRSFQREKTNELRAFKRTQSRGTQLKNYASFQQKATKEIALVQQKVTKDIEVYQQQKVNELAAFKIKQAKELEKFQSKKQSNKFDKPPDLNPFDSDSENSDSEDSESEDSEQKEPLQSTKSTHSEYENGNNEIIKQLVQFGYERTEVIAAIYLVKDKTNINDIKEKIEEIQSMSSHKHNNTHGTNNNTDEISQLSNVIQGHMSFMQKQETSVNEMITESKDKEKLTTAKEKALETEKELLKSITSVTAIAEFLNNIILIENLFNAEYSAEERQKQKNARQKYAQNINFYENKPKPICNAPSFNDLLYTAYTDLSSFKKFLKSVVAMCKDKNVKIISNSGANQKNIERAFYKSFYVYSVMHGNSGHKQMTDVLRCSLVFESFEDLYQCFGIIEHLSKEFGGILRCKDRFDPEMMPFGYRDLLMNINCPSSKIPIVCEVQLHHSIFYKHKKVSHNMYKRARLFDKNGNNSAYNYALKYVKDSIGNKKYEYENVSKSKERGLLKEWGLEQYGNKLITEEGYEDLDDWRDLGKEELIAMGFKPGHAKKFVRKVKDT